MARTGTPRALALARNWGQACKLKSFVVIIYALVLFRRDKRMARKPRLHIPGAFYHVILRGNDGQSIFFSEEDRYRFCLLLQEGVERFDFCIHSFCFMTNHVHLVIQVGNESLSKIVQNIAFRYTRYVNRKQNRIGHLFQGRFKSILVDEENYLTGLLSYIHLNPVRAKIVKHPKEYRWCSHRAYLGIDHFAWLTTTHFLKRFSEDIQDARARFDRMILSALSLEPSLDQFKKGNQREHMILGDESFLDRLSKKAKLSTHFEPSLNELVDVICQFYQVSSHTIKSSDQNRCLTEIRGLVALLAKCSEKISLTDVAKFFNRDLSTMSRITKRYEAKNASNLTFHNKVEQIKNLLATCKVQA